MKTTIYLALLSVLIPAIASTQNFQTIQSDKTPFFVTTGSDYFLANRIDQIDVIGSDSIFYPFQSIRDDKHLNQTDPCKYYIGPSWMGDKVVIKPNGENVFYNEAGEPITILTTAVLHDTFTVYTYPNGDWIKGEVSSVSAVSIFGYPDSMKIINLFSNAQMNLTNPRFVLSKDHGFIELFAPYSFPYPYEGSSPINDISDYPLEHMSNFSLVGEGANGFSKPTVGEINSYEIGDIHQFRYTEEVFDVSKKEQFTEREIFNKFVWGQDSVVYFLKNKGFTKVIDIAQGTTAVQDFDGEMESWTISHINQWQNAFLPEEFDGTNGWSSLFINECGDLEEKVRTENIETSASNSCLQLIEGDYGHFSSIKNVGNLPANGSDSNASYAAVSELIYYSRPNGESCGNAAVLSTNEEAMRSISIYPNPCSDYLTINGINQTSIITVGIYDQLGKQVYLDQLLTSASTIDISHLKAGMYQVLINDGKANEHKTLVVNR